MATIRVHMQATRNIKIDNIQLTQDNSKRCKKYTITTLEDSENTIFGLYPHWIKVSISTLRRDTDTPYHLRLESAAPGPVGPEVSRITRTKYETNIAPLSFDDCGSTRDTWSTAAKCRVQKQQEVSYIYWIRTRRRDPALYV